MKVLYICTHNRCRSILSEAITNQLAEGKIVAKSAGSQPVGAVHPLSIKYLEKNSIDTTGLVSQSWDEFESFAPDLVVTVCDSAAGETCPVWFGNTLKMHWGLEDPSKIEGDETAQAEAFEHTIQIIKERVADLLAISFGGLDKVALKAELQRLGAIG